MFKKIHKSLTTKTRRGNKLNSFFKYEKKSFKITKVK